MWNGQPGPPAGGYAPPPGAAGGFGYPSPQIPHANYPSPQPAGGYPPPTGPAGGPPPTRVPPSYGAPPGPPPQAYGSPQPFASPHAPPHGGYPGQHQTHQPPTGPYAPPLAAAIPHRYASPPGPPQMPPSHMQHYGPHVQGPNQQVQQPYFQYSQCTGRKKALCIGINYIGQSGELRGCHNDARNLVNFLCSHFGYKQEDIVVLTDDPRNHPRQIPTRANIISAMQWLVQNARPNDSLFFHYSGHGGQTKDLNGDEADGFDEVIYPVDYKATSHIVDDDMHMIMVKPLPPGCRLTAIFDSCHSGSALDLPYIYSTEGKIKEPNLAAEAGQGLFSAATSYLRGDMGGVMSGVSSVFKSATGQTQKAEEYARRTRTSPADVISWSGCKDAQTSADTVEAGKATGAMSYAFIRALSGNRQQTYSQLLISLRGILKSSGYDQKPQLSSSHPMDTNLLFIV